MGIMKNDDDYSHRALDNKERIDRAFEALDEISSAVTEVSKLLSKHDRRLQRLEALVPGPDF